MSDGGAALIVIAKEPVPGRAKTRLSPPLAPEQGAWLAAAALDDTFAAVLEADSPARRVVAFDGDPRGWVPAQLEVVAQADGGLDRRLAAAFAEVGGPALLIGMDTPQVTPELLDASLAKLLEPGVDAVLGLAPDGGYWAIGFREPDPKALLGVPMSTDDTGAEQLARLRELGLATEMLPELRDFDTFEDALAVAAEAPGSHLAAAIAPIARALDAASADAPSGGAR
ncbi:glycosyltransferase [Thermoleophilia bacterium SCSIO 60948]|nr:glycosyltransferase [Thermoleophilia bacterium SCSIO 60948]